MKLTITNMLLLVTIAALGIALAIAVLSRDPVVTVRSEDSKYSFKFRQELLRASPRWREESENPPLSVREAMKIAGQICDELNEESKPFKIGNWDYDKLTFTHLNFGYRDMSQRNSSTKWCYIAHFQTLNSQNSNSQVPELASFMILMDGTVYVGESAWFHKKLEDAMRKRYPWPRG